MKKQALLLFTLFSSPLLAHIQLSPLPLEKIGKAAQFALSEQGELVIINQKGELWKKGDTQPLAQHLSPQIAPSVGYQRIAAADKQNKFFLWTAEKSYTSDIVLAENATMETLAFATIAVAKQNNTHKLVRIETQGDKALITAESRDEVLPDARPLQINFESTEKTQGHIAILAKPDRSTYQHGVLGDDLEAAEIQYLERHSLQPLATSLSAKGLVFEANQLATFQQQGKNKLISVMSGDGEGGRTVLIESQNGKLSISAQSEPLPNHRWQSPFVFNQTLYAVQMPHLIGRLVSYHQQGEKLQEKSLESGLSNHAYGEYETNLAAVTQHFAIIPQQGYRNVAVIDNTGKLEKLSTTLPAAIIKTQSSSDKAYLLLENGEIWVAEKR